MKKSTPKLSPSKFSWKKRRGYRGDGVCWDCIIRIGRTEYAIEATIYAEENGFWFEGCYDSSVACPRNDDDMVDGGPFKSIETAQHRAERYLHKIINRGLEESQNRTERFRKLQECL
jgi:hypothetical protein